MEDDTRQIASTSMLRVNTSEMNGQGSSRAGSSPSHSPNLNQHLLPTNEMRDTNQTPSPRLRGNEEGHFTRGPSTPGVRISRMMMGKPGGPPPPPGPPPLGPPPMPPASTHPFAQPQIPTQRSSSLQASTAGPSNTYGPDRSQARVSMININNRASRLPPLAPPPTTSLPPIPTGQNQGQGHRRQTSITSSISSSGSRVRRISSRSNNDPMISSRSSSSGHPPISPRSSSLLSPSHAQTQSRSSGPSTSTSSAGHAPAASTTSRPERPTHAGRTPSRSLLQSALDLAQKAVEMDKGNDVDGALGAYHEAVDRLKLVMERVGTQPPRPGNQAESAAKAEQEGRTLRGIHDAYLARIALLSSYERPDAFADGPMASTSTLLAGRRDERNGGDRTPTRSSLDETAHVGIGNLMLDDDHSSLTTPSKDWNHEDQNPRTPHRDRAQDYTSPSPHFKALPPASPRGLNLNIPLETSSSGSLSLQQALDNAADNAIESTTAGPSRSGSHTQLGLGLGHPSTSPRAVVAASTISPEMTPSKKRDMLRAKLASEHTNFMGSEDYEEGMTGSQSRSSIGQATTMSQSPQMTKSPEMIRSSSASTPSSVQGATLSPRMESGSSISPRLAQGSVYSGSPDLTPSKKRDLLRAKIAAGQIEMINSETHDDDYSAGMHSRNASLAGSVTSSHGDKSLPALPNQSPIEQPVSAFSPRRSSLMQPRIDGLLVSPTTTAGRIAQRRLSRQPGGGQSSISSMTEIGPASAVFPTGPSGRSISTTSSPQGHTPRTRSKSQPGTRPDLFRNITDANQPPPLPAIPRNVSAQYATRNLAVSTNGLAPPQSISTAMASPHSISRSISSSLMSPPPEPQPMESAHRPFHLLRIIQASVDPHGSGAYLTGAIHISPHIWQTSIHTRGSTKNQFRILAQDTKVRCMESLILNLEIARATGIPLLDGPRELKYGAPLTHIPPPRAGEGLGKIGDDFAQALDALEDEMDQSYKLLSKAGVAVNGWKGKKSVSNSKSWGSRLTRSMDKMTHNKALDSSDKYVELLSHFCAAIQGIDDHLYNFTGPCSPSYHYLSPRTRSAIEQRILKAAEFASKVVVPFILDDFKQFFGRYLKGGVKYLED